MFEEKILPNLAYVGGPGESAYWMQLKSIFEYHNINYPMVILRDSVQWIDTVSQQKLMKIDVDIQQIFQSIEMLEQQYIKTSATSFSSDKYFQQLNVLFDGLSQDVSKIDQKKNMRTRFIVIYIGLVSNTKSLSFFNQLVYLSSDRGSNWRIGLQNILAITNRA